jgi:UDP-2-acetamido-3-amino-2,3-dideoxy-glucuronate N-acetyltransferase
MFKVAVIGCGYWGKNLVRNFYELDALSHIWDADPNSLRLMQERYAGVSAAKDYEALLRDDSVNAVVIATPAEQHFTLAEAALLAGKDVFVEKPLALRYSDGEKLVRLAEKTDQILMVGHLLEYHPAILKLNQIVDSGELGKIQYLYSNRLNLGRVRREENILWSFAPHDIAVILRLIGEQPIEVTSTGGAYLQPNIADVTVTNLLFDNGVRAHIFVSWLHPYKEHRLVVIGSKKMASFNDGAPENKLQLYDQGIDWVNGTLVPRKGEGTMIEFNSEEPLKLECQHFLECVRTRKSPRTDGASALDVLRVLQASQRSLQTQGQPVQVLARTLESVAM